MTKSLAQLKAREYRVPVGTKRVALECGHTALYVRPRPSVGESAFCRECGTWSTRVGDKPPGGPSRTTRRSLRCARHSVREEDTMRIL